MDPFDPTFDDCAWNDAWLRFPIIQVLPGVYPSFTVRSWEMTEADICGQTVRLTPPLAVRGLITPDGTLWMSDVPQERLMMFNNAAAARGRTLVGGLGLGLYPQYAMPRVSAMTIIERDPALIRVVGPVVEVAAAAHNVPVEMQQGDIHEVLAAAPTVRYDTIFLDTWETLDAAHLPYINTLRDLAIPHLAPGGRVLLWGYRWMVRLFEGACERLLRLEPGRRHDWLAVMTRQHPAVWALLLPVVEHFAGQEVERMDEALDWCRRCAATLRPGPGAAPGMASTP
ncbi:MAG: hypothetical protein Kow00124_14660 [Anaerolineae bacterium]